MSCIDNRLSRRNRDQQNNSDIDDGTDHWQRLGPLVRRIVSRLNVPTPTAILIAEAAGYTVEAN